MVIAALAALALALISSDFLLPTRAMAQTAEESQSPSGPAVSEAGPAATEASEVGPEASEIGSEATEAPPTEQPSQAVESSSEAEPAPDLDGDGVADDVDNCREIMNAGQGGRGW